MVIIRKDSWNRQYAAETVKKTLLDFLFYLFFLVVISVVSNGWAGSSTYYLSDMLHKKLVSHPFDLNEPDNTTDKVDETTFAEVITVHEYWAFLDLVFLPTFYDDDDEDNTDLPNQPNGVSPHERITRRKVGRINARELLTSQLVNVRSDIYLETENLVLGPPRIRQIRVQNGSCHVHQVFANKFRDCYAAFRPGDEETKPFGVAGGTAWTHTRSADLDGIFYWGTVGSYPGGGYYQDLFVDPKTSRTVVEHLEANHWIDRATRVVFLEFSIYNANMNLFCVAKLIAEFPATGGVITSFSFPTVKLLRFVRPFDYVVLGCEIIFLLMVIYFTVVELCEICRERWLYFRSFWNFIDLAIVTIAFTSMAFSGYRYFNTWNIFADSSSQHVNMDRIAFWQVQFNTALALCVFLAWIKVFKYMSFNKIMLQLSTTLSRCAKDLLAFGLMFLIVFIAYAQLGYILFGTDNPDFRTYTDSIITLMRTILGDFDYLAIERSNRILGPIYFVTYIFFVFFVLLNMFLAIINDTYSDVKSLEGLQKVHVGSFLRQELIGCSGTIARLFHSWSCRRCRRVQRPTMGRPTTPTNVPSSSSERVSPVESVIRQEDLTHHRQNENYETIDNTLSRLPLRELFEPVPSRDIDHDSDQNREAFSLNRRLTVVEQTLETIVFRLNGFLGRMEDVLNETSGAESTNV